MDDEKEIIYIALSNSISYYRTLLESSKELPKEDEIMAKHILLRTEQLLDMYALLIDGNEKLMDRPRW